ncbi:unnamed protein product, partial [Nesidiocoris tenuis]
MTRNFQLFTGGGFLGKIIHACLVGKGELPDVNEVNSDNSSRTLRQDALLLSFCFIGLQGSYLTWGILQEKIMTQRPMEEMFAKRNYDIENVQWSALFD